nr:glycosyltransferase [Salinibacter ruber]
MFENQYVVYEEKAKAFRGAKVVVNNQHPGEVWGVNKRTFEAAGIGGFQLVTWRPGLEQLFSVGEELVAYRGISDLKDKIDYYLERDEERTEIAKRARERALRDHTYEQRLSLMMDTIFGDEDGHPHPEGLRFG